uniref:THAP-type domain-containing protein n=1 Tax=Maylandia zebra TaxID=106582 RepID=A0A3P9BYH3_9CICH
MVRTCCAVGCKVRLHNRQGNKVENGLSFHSFPTWKQHEAAHVSDVTKRRRLVWIAAVRPADIQFDSISKYLLVCSRHFHSGNSSISIRSSPYILTPSYTPLFFSFPSVCSICLPDNHWTQSL